MPLRDDWASAAELIRQIDLHDQSSSYSLEILLVDDASVERCNPSTLQHSFSTIRSVQVLRLRRNLGHQRAIAIGLMHVRQAISCQAVVVMDADGEDTVEGLFQLLATYSSIQGTACVFAARARRAESLTFRAFYLLYKTTHRALTGISVRVGNFSIIPSEYLSTLGVTSDLWNHYAAALFRSRLPLITTPISRGRRIAGHSKMNFAALVMHGLSAISVFGDVVGVRLLIGSLVACMISLLGIITAISIRFLTNLAIPGWTTLAAGTLTIILVQFITIASIFTFFVLTNRATLGFVPMRDYLYFVENSETMYSHV